MTEAVELVEKYETSSAKESIVSGMKKYIGSQTKANMVSAFQGMGKAFDPKNVADAQKAEAVKQKAVHESVLTEIKTGIRKDRSGRTSKRAKPGPKR